MIRLISELLVGHPNFLMPSLISVWIFLVILFLLKFYLCVLNFFIISLSYVFMNFIKGFIPILFMILEHISGAILKSLSCVSAVFYFSGCTALRLQASGRVILFWLFMFVFLSWKTGYWSYDVWGIFWCQYLILSLLDRYFILCLLLTFLCLWQVWKLWSPW